MSESKEKTLINFKKAQSLIGNLIKMVEGDSYCVDIMQHNLAVIGLLKSAHQMLLEGHLNTCFKKAMTVSGEKRKDEAIKELLQLTKLSNK